MITDKISKHSNIILNKKHELIRVNSAGMKMVGLSYINYDDSNKISKKLDKYNQNEKYENSFWEEILFEKNKMIIYGKELENNCVFEINTYEDLRNIDSQSISLDSSSIQLIANIFNTDTSSIKNISYLKKGMTNNSFIFEYQNCKYIMRIPGEGTEQLINRLDEYNVYQRIKPYHLSDEIIYMNRQNGYKITKFLKNTRTCNPDDIEDIRLCMSFLKKFHQLNLQVSHEFNIYEKIDFYEKLRGKKSLYKDYLITKRNVLSLQKIIDNSEKNWSLTHIDAVPDNFLIYEEQNSQVVKLIDWEYASMQDPHVDLAMFCIYALYDKKKVDQIIDIYFDSKCDTKTRIKIYCYIAIHLHSIVMQKIFIDL